jgi:hypothetical protein
MIKAKELKKFLPNLDTIYLTMVNIGGQMLFTDKEITKQLCKSGKTLAFGKTLSPTPDINHLKDWLN